MAYVFHKDESCSDCTACGRCVNCVGLKELVLEFQKHKFYYENSDVVRWEVWYDDGLKIKPLTSNI